MLGTNNSQNLDENTFKARWHESHKFQTTEIWGYMIIDIDSQQSPKITHIETFIAVRGVNTISSSFDFNPSSIVAH